MKRTPAGPAAGVGTTYQRIYRAVRRIPRGRVATYGQIAELAGLPGAARQVGYALSALAGAQGVPWHRVVNASGRVSRRADPADEVRQQQRLEEEGVVFDERDRIELARFRYAPRRRSGASIPGPG